MKFVAKYLIYESGPSQNDSNILSMFAKCQILLGKLDCLIPLKKTKNDNKIKNQDN